MTVSFQDVTLDSGNADVQAVLAIRDGRLAAVLTRLSGIHEDLEGTWFVEAVFGLPTPLARDIFSEPGEFASWLMAEADAEQ